MLASKLAHLEIKLDRLREVLSIHPDLTQELLALLRTSSVTSSLRWDLPATAGLEPVIYHNKEDNSMLLLELHTRALATLCSTPDFVVSHEVT